MRQVAVAIVFCSVVAGSGTAWAGDGPGAPVPLQAWLRREAAPYADPRYTAIISEGRNKLAFLVPPGFLLRGDPASGTLTLANREGNCAITFAVLKARSFDDSTLSTDDYRESVLKDYPTGKIVQEFSRAVAGGTGPGFDFQWKASGAIVECKRVLFIYSRAGVLEFTATTSRANFEALNGRLDSMLQTFHYSTDGVLKVPPLPSDD